MRSFRAAHAWLRGYSDSLAGKPQSNVAWPDFNRDYDDGYHAARA